MKEFIKNYLVCMVITEVFLFCGGFYLFDFRRHFFLAGAAVAFLLAVLVSVWLAQEARIAALKKRIEELENKEKDL